NSARLILALYNDGTGTQGFAGDVIANFTFGVVPGSDKVTLSFQIFHCADSACGISTARGGSFGVIDNPAAIHVLSISWDGGKAVTFAFNGAAQTLDPTQLAIINGSPISGYTGLSVVGVSRVSAAFDNVFIGR